MILEQVKELVITKIITALNKINDVPPGLKLAGHIIRGLKGISGKVKAKVAVGKAWVKGKVEAGEEWAKGKVDAAKAKLTGKPEDDQRTPSRSRKRWTRLSATSKVRPHTATEAAVITTATARSEASDHPAAQPAC